MITNNCTFIGRLTKDCDYKVSPNGVPVASFSLAVERTYKDKQGQKIVDFFDFKAFKNHADVIANNTAKGTLLAVSCHLTNDNYEKDGKKIYRNSLIVDEVRLLASTKNNSQQPQSQGNAQNQGYGQTPNYGGQPNYDGQGNYGGQPQYGQPSYNQPPQNYGGNQGYGGNYQPPQQPQYQSANGTSVNENDLPF